MVRGVAPPGDHGEWIARDCAKSRREIRHRPLDTKGGVPKEKRQSGQAVQLNRWPLTKLSLLCTPTLDALANLAVGIDTALVGLGSTEQGKPNAIVIVVTDAAFAAVAVRTYSATYVVASRIGRPIDPQFGWETSRILATFIIVRTKRSTLAVRILSVLTKNTK